MRKINRKWSVQEQSVFLKRVGELLERGYTLTEAVLSTMYQINPEKKQQIEQSLKALKEGNPFYSVLQTLRFHPNLISYVFFAEQHGDLSVAFAEGSQMMIRREKNKKELSKLLSYPLLLVIVTGVLMFFIKQLLLPKFITLFESMGLESNIFTSLVYLFDTLLPNLLILFIITTCTLLSYYFFHFKKISAIAQKETIVSLPVLGRFYRLILTHYFSIQLSHLLNGGFSILESLTQFEGNKQNSFDQALGSYLKNGLSSGRSLEEIVKSLKCFEPELVLIIVHGQHNGKLDQELYFYSKQCIEIFQQRMGTALKFIQPIIFGVIGALIVSMYLAILMPMFQMMEGI